MSKESLLDVLRVVDKTLTSWVKVICTILLLIIVITVAVAVFTRFVIFYPLNFADSLSKYLLMWMVFLGVGLAVRGGEHIAVDMFIKRLNKKSQKILFFTIYILTSIFLLAVTYYGFINALKGMNTQDPMLFGMSMIIPYLSVPVGAFYSFVQLSLTTVITLLSGQERISGNSESEFSTVII